MGIRILLVFSVLLLTTVSAHINCIGGNCGVSSITCPIGFQLSGNQCIQSSTTACVTGGTGPCHVCPDGFYHQQGRCERYICPNNHVFMNGHCQVLSQNCHQVCRTGYVLMSGLCHLQTPQPCVQQQCSVAGGCQQQCQGSQCCPQPPIIIHPTIHCPTHPPVTYPPTTPAPTTPIPPPPCPEGTVFIYGECRVIGVKCPPGLIYHEGSCIKLDCPRNTSWDGQRCQAVNQVSTNTSVDIKQFINNYNNISNPTNVNLNNENTVYVYTSDERVVKINGSAPPSTSPPITATTPIIITQPPPVTQRPGNCCTVVTPRVCSNLSNRWVCYNRRYSRCGSFCTYPKIYLRPVRPAQRLAFMVVPPRFPIETCSGHQCGFAHADCSGCLTGGSCTSYCHEYSCGSQCDFYDQRQYCEEYPGQPGCFEADGCYEDWCS